MPRLSLWHPQKSNDYRFLDRTISEMYTVGGVDIYVHKYLGPRVNTEDSIESGNYDATQPNYPTEDPLFIQDLLLLENRDRAYDPDVYRMRGVYNIQDIDFNLTQFGLFLTNDTLFITFHYNDMIDTFQRKLMSGDVLEVPNLQDPNPLDTRIPRALPKYYVIQDAAYAGEGFSATWWPHLWRVKATPMVNAQEYREITDKPFTTENIWDPGQLWPQGSIVNAGDQYYRARIDVPPGTPVTDTNYWTPIQPPSVATEASTRPRDLAINDAILTQSEIEVPLSGYDTTKFWIMPTNPDGTPADPTSVTAAGYTPVPPPNTAPQYSRFVIGSVTAPGSSPVSVSIGVSFPDQPSIGQRLVRIDQVPNRLYRWDGTQWAPQELHPDAVINYSSFPVVENPNGQITVDSTAINSSEAAVSPRADGYLMGYMTGDGIPPNGLPVTPGVAFPSRPVEGQYCLRLDYWPNRLFRFNGRAWIRIEDAVRTNLTNGPDNYTLRSSFVNNTYTVPTTDLGNIPSRQSLSEALRPRADNGDQGGNLPPNPRPPGR